MKMISMSPWTFAAGGVIYSLFNWIAKGKFDPFILLFWLTAAFIEVFARKQNKIPSSLLTFISSLAIIFFIRGNVVSIKTFSSSSAEPFIHKGSTIFYQPKFFSIHKDDLVLIKGFDGEKKHFVCRVMDVKGQNYVVEIISRRKTTEATSSDIEGKIFHVTDDKKQGL